MLRAKLGNRSASSIDRDVTDGRLPRPVLLGRKRYWIEAEVDAWMTEIRDRQSAERAAKT